MIDERGLYAPGREIEPGNLTLDIDPTMSFFLIQIFFRNLAGPERFCLIRETPTYYAIFEEFAIDLCGLVKTHTKVAVAFGGMRLSTNANKHWHPFKN